MAKAVTARAIINNKVSAETLWPQTFRQHIQSSKKEILAFCIFHLAFAALLCYCYPYPDTTSDTGGYIRWAIENSYGGPRPLGYSYFLSFLHSISGSSFIVFVIQFITFSFSQLFLYLTSTYVFGIENQGLRWLFLIVLAAFISGLYTTNTILSDNLFLSLTMLLISLCIWLIAKPSMLVIACVMATCMLCITIRYTGLLYPIIIILSFFFSLKRIPAIAASFVTGLIVILYINHVADKTEDNLDVHVFSAFGGWQKANNALHVLPHLDLSKKIIETDDPDMQYTDDILRTSYPVLKTKFPATDEVSYDFIWSDSLPLRQILYRKIETDKASYYHTWNYMGVVFNNYANELIKTYPKLYLRYFICNNAKRLVYPDNEVLIRYNFTGAPGKYEKDWFRWKESDNIKPRTDILRPLLLTLPFTYSTLWIVFLIAVIFYTYLVHKKRIPRHYLYPSLLIAAFVIMYAVANIIAAPVNTRFLMPVRSCIIVFAVVCINAYMQYKNGQTKA